LIRDGGQLPFVGRTIWATLSTGLLIAAIWRMSDGASALRRAVALFVIPTVMAVGLATVPLNPTGERIARGIDLIFDATLPWAVCLGIALTVARLTELGAPPTNRAVALAERVAVSARTQAARLLLIGSLLFLVGALWVSYAILGPVPHTIDETSFMFCTRTLQSGAVKVALGPEYDFFQYCEYIRPIDGYGWALTQPGWAAMLAPFDAAGLRGVANPLYTALAVLLLAWVIHRWMGTGAAVIGVLLAVTSPWLLVSAGSLMSHTPGMLAVVATLACAVRACRQSSPEWAALSGLMLGIGFTIRPHIAVIWGGVLAAVAARWLWAGHRRVAVAWLVGAAVPFVLWMFFNATVTGRPLYNTLDACFDQIHPDAGSIGFGEVKGQPFRFVANEMANAHGMDAQPGGGGPHRFARGHSPLKGLFDMGDQIQAGSRFALGWGVFSFAPALVLLAIPRASRLAGVSRKLVVGASIAVLMSFVIHSAYWYHGIAFGPRFHVEVIPALWALQLAGLFAVRGWLIAHGTPSGAATAGVAAFVAVNVIWSIGGSIAALPTSEYAHYHNVPRHAFDRADELADSTYPDDKLIVFWPTRIFRNVSETIVINGEEVPVKTPPRLSFFDMAPAAARLHFPIGSDRVLYAIDWDRLMRFPAVHELVAGPRLDDTPGARPALGRAIENAELRTTFPDRIAVRATVHDDGTVTFDELWRPPSR
jgi:hypothetical protein